MTRFFLRPSQFVGDQAVLEGSDAHHAVHVLRMRPGDRFHAVDEAGMEHLVEVVTISDAQVAGRILSSARPEREPHLYLGLLQALLKGKRMNLALNQCTQVGVRRFQLVRTRRVVARLPADRIESRLARWREIIKGAAEQSGRTAIPDIISPIPWREAVDAAVSEGPCIVLYEGEAPPLKSVLDGLGRTDRLWLGLGPEGGFDESEIEEALAAGAQLASLGPRILRAETASVVAAAIALYACDTGR